MFAKLILSYLFKLYLPDLPFVNWMGLVFLIALALLIVVSLVTAAQAGRDTIEARDIRYVTRLGFNISAVGVCLILRALYATWW